MNHFFQKPFRWAMVYGAVLSLSFALVLLDAFVIPRAYRQEAVAEAPNTNETSLQPQSAQGTKITESSYEDENITISIETLRVYDTTVYVADIQLSDASLLRTALAQGTYGRNIKATTSAIATANNAIFAINGDYYGFRDNGYMLRNGVLYRETESGADALVIDQNGDFSIVTEGSASAQSLLTSSAWQVFSFGPALVNGGQVAVDQGSEVSGKSMNSNPRTAIGQAGPLHYIFIVSDGRTSGNAGLSLYELAQVFVERGCTVAYNLDGGGSSSMVFQGEVINQPVDGKKSGGERAVSDIVYIGYP